VKDAAAERQRERLRQAMTRAGDLDLMRVVAARRDDGQTSPARNGST
jgi:hypothetical protein